MRLDLSPLREFRDFRLLLGSGLITMLGTVITTVAVPFQMKQLTESYVAVGLVGMAEFVPMVVCGLWGGAIADARDRRTIVILSELGLCLSSVLLLVNALLPRPQVWVLYAAGALAAGLGSLRRPSEQALINRVLPLDRMPAAFAVQGLVLNAAMIAGPAAGGLIVATLGPAASYGVDVATFLLSLALLVRVGAVPRTEEPTPASLRSLLEGVRYALRRPDLMGTYLVDIAAMAFASSTALFPFLAENLGAPKAVGVLYAAGGVGAVIASLTSGWTAHVHRHGLAVIVSATLWGVAVALAALMPDIWLVFLFLAVAGGADMVSGLFRGTIWNQSIRSRGNWLSALLTAPDRSQVRRAIRLSCWNSSKGITPGPESQALSIPLSPESARTFITRSRRAACGDSRRARRPAGRACGSPAGPGPRRPRVLATWQAIPRDRQASV
ncbi:MFS transporter [Microbispora camponoti]|uniref:MFS transporter n=1 Tax=Microbispora bryophytorum subsp. camponoti TaxID=1677852 RepID=A0ABR8LF86_9ACTN|nr:MFS transporter [Microbispora camponoti]